MGSQAASRPATLSERADELEERMMQELNERVATKSVLFTLADGQTTMESGASLQAKGMVFNAPDPQSFREALKKAGFYEEWKKNYGAEAWALLEKFTGSLA